MYYGAGHIVPWPSNQSIMDIMTDTLTAYDAGGLFFSPGYSLVVYPSGVNSWKFFDDRFIDSPQAGLRFVMFTPIPELLNHTTLKMAQIGNSPTPEFESEANVLFRQFFGVKYTNLLWQGNTNNVRKDSFYLMYPTELEDEKNVIIRWLEANTAKIYTSFVVGDWDRFTSSVEAGVVLVSNPFLLCSYDLRNSLYLVDPRKCYKTACNPRSGPLTASTIQHLLHKSPARSLYTRLNISKIQPHTPLPARMRYPPHRLSPPKLSGGGHPHPHLVSYLRTPLQAQRHLEAGHTSAHPRLDPQHRRRAHQRRRARLHANLRTDLPHPATRAHGRDR